MRRVIILCGVLICILGGLFMVAAQDEERLVNPGMEEGSFGPYTTRRGGEFPIYLPSSWNVWLAAQSGDFFNRGDRTTINPHPGPGPDPREGNRALNIDCGFVTCTVAIYQQVSVTPGTNVQASAWAQVKACNLPDNATTCGSAVESGARTRIGIDPNGGTNPDAGGIVWSGFVEPHDRWEQMTVSATTAGNTITLFLYSTQNSTADINKTYWDQTSLRGGGTGSPGEPASTAVPPTPTPPPVVAFVVPQNARPDGSIVHTVQAGDTLDSIAFAYQKTRTELLELNPDIRAQGAFLQIGQQVLIQAATAQEPTPEPPPPVEEPPADEQPVEEQPPAQEVFIPPVVPGDEVVASIVQLGAFSDNSGTLLIGQSPNQPTFDLSLLPRLGLPVGVDARSSDNTANGRRSAISTVALVSDLTAEQIVDVYNEQLTNNGWEAVAASSDDEETINPNIGWSTWRFEDASGITWGATVTIIASPTNPGEYTATLQIKEQG